MTAGFAEDHGLEVGSPLTVTFLAGERSTSRSSGSSSRARPPATSACRSTCSPRPGCRARTPRSASARGRRRPRGGRRGAGRGGGATPIVAVYDKQEFADSIRDQVNQLLYIIYGLLALAIVIAVIGIVNTLGLSRHRAHPGDRPAPGDRHEPAAAAADDHAGVGRDRGPRRGAGLGLGLVIGVILRESLKEDLTSLGLPLSQLAVFLVIAVVVGVLAAVLPSIRASRLNVLDAIAEE